MFGTMGHAEAQDPSKKHRHDIGAPDHGAEHTERTTKNIQIVLGACILATIGILIYAVLLAAGV